MKKEPLFNSELLMIFKIITNLLIISALLTACNSGGGDSDVEEGITVTITATHQQSADALGQTPLVPAGIKTFSNSEGTLISLTKAYLTLWSTELESDCNLPDFVQWQRSLFNWLIPTVNAHAPAAPTRLAIPNVINLLDADLKLMTLGVIQPPPNSYCGMRVEMLKADEDTQHLPTDFDMVNRTLYLEGSYLMSGTSQAIPFSIATAKTLRPRYLLLPTTLDLSSSHRTAQLAIHITYDRWFDGLNLPVLVTDEFQQTLLFNNVTESLKIAK
jgi:hypothetical protein